VTRPLASSDVSTLCVVPVTLPESWGGFATNRGVVRFDGHRIEIEYQTKDGMFEMALSDIRRVDLPLPAIAAFAWASGWLGGTFDLNVTSLELTRDLPGGDQGRIRLKVARRDRPAAEQLAAEVELAMANRVLERIDADAGTSSDPGLRRPASGPISS